jgi:ribonuclease HI
MINIDIYTDGSHTPCINKKDILGYSCILVDDLKDYKLTGLINRNTVKDYFKIDVSVDKIGIEHAELIAISKAIWQFRKSKDLNIRIFGDNLGGLRKIVKFLDGGENEFKKNKLKAYRNIVAFIANTIISMRDNNCEVELFWIKSHNGTYGNELADKTVKSQFSSKAKFKDKKMNKKSKTDHFNDEKNEFYQFKIDRNII